MRPFRFLMAVSLVALVSVTGCQSKSKGPLEKTGERIDEIADNVSEGEAPLKRKGPLEKAGEAIDETVSGEK